MVSFRKALEQGARMVELDVRLTRDGVPVLMHDATLGRTTDGHGFVARRSWEKIRQLDAGSWFDKSFQGEPVPDLGSCLEELAPQIPVNIEIKCLIGNYRPVSDAVLSLLRHFGRTGRFLVTSFNHRAVDYVARALPDLPVGRLFHPLYHRKVHQAHLDWLRHGRGSRSPAAGEVPWEGRAAVVESSMVKPELVQQVHEAGGTLLVYTVNEVEDMRRVVECGVDAVITNYPARFAELLQKA